MYYNWKGRDRRYMEKQKRILTNFQNIITLRRKRHAFDKIKSHWFQRKAIEKEKLYHKVERTFTYLGRNMPFTIERWIMEDVLLK